MAVSLMHMTYSMRTTTKERVTPRATPRLGEAKQRISVVTDNKGLYAHVTLRANVQYLLCYTAAPSRTSAVPDD
eukprot:8198-Heterococcus_DN1.PRE.3